VCCVYVCICVIERTHTHTRTHIYIYTHTHTHGKILLPDMCMSSHQHGPSDYKCMVRGCDMAHCTKITQSTLVSAYTTMIRDIELQAGCEGKCDLTHSYSYM